ncbi:MAG: prepilin-type N-terminal cleavage/methylation domain-containing protein [Peptostreptococcaceae bacterium]
MKKSNRGFTLLEVLISISILTIIVLSFANFLSSNIKYNVKNEQDIKALNIATSEIENLRYQIKNNQDIFFTTDDKEFVELLNAWEINDEINIKANDPYKRVIKIEKNENIYTVHVKITKDGAFSTNKETKLIAQIFSNE